MTHDQPRRPGRPATGQTPQYSFRLDPTLVEAARTVAQAKHETLTAVVARSLREYVATNPRSDMHTLATSITAITGLEATHGLDAEVGTTREITSDDGTRSVQIWNTTEGPRFATYRYAGQDGEDTFDGDIPQSATANDLAAWLRPNHESPSSKEI